MCKFLKIINTIDGQSYIYDANINKIGKLPEKLEGEDFDFSLEYLKKKKKKYKTLLEKVFFKERKMVLWHTTIYKFNLLVVHFYELWYNIGTVPVH